MITLPQIFPVTSHTDHVGPGSTFVAIPGKQHPDVQPFIALAIAKGATTIVTEQTSTAIIPAGITHIRTENPRAMLATLAHQAAGWPAQKLTIVGITGTSGKTTTSYAINHIMQAAGLKTALLGGIENKILNQPQKSTSSLPLTTQMSDYLAVFLKTCVEQGVTHVVMEVTSHALQTHRVDGISFNIAVFTNLSQDHLDFHHSMEQYFESKMRIFSMLRKNGIVVINTEDEWGLKAARRLCKNDPSISRRLIGINHSYHKTFSVNSIDPLLIPKSHLPGLFNRYNTAQAYAVGSCLGIPVEAILASITSFSGAPGRMQLHKLRNGTRAYIDFAHKPGAFENVVATLRSETNHLIVVFGCGGNRDQTKRPIMGHLAATYADSIILTNDNPRFEDPMAIIDEILSGIPEAKRCIVVVEPDRRKAIEHAIKQASRTSIIALLGKGHECYLVEKDIATPFDDLDELIKADR